MKTIGTLTVATLIAASAAMAADGSRADKILAAKPGLVMTLDDDGGRVELYHRSHSARELEYHGGAVVREPLVEIVLVGAWDSPALQSRAKTLRRAFDSLSASDAFTAMHDRGVKATALPITTRTLEGSAKMNDLSVQRVIDRSIESGSLPSRDENTIYVLFLSPQIASTLGEKHASTDYASYHSHFQTHDVNVRYVVVPFDDDVKSMNDAAAASVIRAIVNPDGDGWY